jgi:hypothetical protein
VSLAIVRRTALALFAAGMLAQPVLAADTDAAVKAATEQAEQWLKAMDGHRYHEGWNEQASAVREGRTEQDWIDEVSGAREALGRPIMRQFKAAEFSTHVRGAPEGQYVLVVYLTKFGNIPLASETILMSLEDGQWLVGGYSIAEAEAPPGASAAPSGAPQPKTKD